MLLSEKINELLNKANSSNNILEINRTVENTTEDLKDFLKIGRIDLIIKNILNGTDICIYQGKTYNNKNKFKDSITINDDCYIELSYCPTKNTVWSEEEFEHITTYIKILLNIYNSIVLKNMLSNTMLTDGVTKALNMPGILHRYEFFKELYSKNLYTCAFISIKNFKYINQTLGMNGGNIVLKMYVDKIQSLFTSKEEICARMGGDNFFITTKKENFPKILENLTDLEIEYNNNKFIINCKMGIADLMPGMHIMAGLENASLAATEAKRDTKNDYVYFNEEIFKTIMTKKTIKNNFAIALKKEEFEVYFQPKVDSLSSKLYGAEALVRWNHEGKMISPGDFIPVLEEDNSICELDFYVLEKTCKYIKEWTEEGLEAVPISVNFAKNHLQSSDFSYRVLSIINKYSIDPKYIEIELTESSAIYSKNALLDFIDTMKKQNIGVSLDDFGTGYSSLNLLKELNISTVKIDKSFVDNIEKEKDNIILGHVISMIKDLKMDVIAEGIETNKQLGYLQELGCFKIQGYLYDKPLKKDDFEKKLKTKQY